MFYEIKITSPSGKEIPIGGKEMEDAVEYLKIWIDTVDENVSNRAANILNRIELKLKLTSETAGICKELMTWAIASRGEDVYRRVHIDISDNDRVIRSFDVDKVFVEDYSEEFSGREETYAVLKMIQKANNSDSFHHDTDQL